MTDPIVGNDNHMYEHTAITEWLPNRYMSPNTRQQMALADTVATGPCFTGDCVVLMADTRYKRVDQLKKGDEVWSLSGSHKIMAVLVTPVHKTVYMVRFTSGLKITPWHPMKFLTDKWVFPHDVGEQCDMFLDTYYNLVLESGHIVEINGHPVCTLGHGFEDNDVIKHPYFGTEAVIKDLKNHPDWESGYLRMDPLRLIRSSETGHVVRIY